MRETRPSNGAGERISARQACSPPRSEAHEQETPDDGALDLDGLDLPDVSGLLARLVAERIPLSLMLDLANPAGPGSEEILAEERPDVE